MIHSIHLKKTLWFLKRFRFLQALHFFPQTIFILRNSQLKMRGGEHEHEQRRALYVLSCSCWNSFSFLFSWWTSCQKLFSKKFHNHFSLLFFSYSSLFFSFWGGSVSSYVLHQLYLLCLFLSAALCCTLLPYVYMLTLLNCRHCCCWLIFEWVLLSLHFCRLTCSFRQLLLLFHWSTNYPRDVWKKWIMRKFVYALSSSSSVRQMCLQDGNQIHNSLHLLKLHHHMKCMYFQFDKENESEPKKKWLRTLRCSAIEIKMHIFLHSYIFGTNLYVLVFFRCLKLKSYFWTWYNIYIFFIFIFYIHI